MYFFFWAYVCLTVSTCFCSAPVTSAAVKPISPFTQQQAQHQQLHQQQQVQQQVLQQHQQHQHQLQFLANALQLQSQLNAQTQMRSVTPATGQFISALDSYQAWCSLLHFGSWTVVVTQDHPSLLLQSAIPAMSDLGCSDPLIQGPRRISVCVHGAHFL